MTNKSSRKNYDDIPAELSLREKVRTIREKALKIKSPDLSKMIQLEVPREHAWYYLKNEKRLQKKIEQLKKNYGENVEYKVKKP